MKISFKFLFILICRLTVWWIKVTKNEINHNNLNKLNNNAESNNEMNAELMKLNVFLNYSDDTEMNMNKTSTVSFKKKTNLKLKMKIKFKKKTKKITAFNFIICI